MPVNTRYINSTRSISHTYEAHISSLNCDVHRTIKHTLHHLNVMSQNYQAHNSTFNSVMCQTPEIYQAHAWTLNSVMYQTPQIYRAHISTGKSVIY